MDLTAIINFLGEFRDSGRLQLLASDPRISFGTDRRPLILSQVLPNRADASNVIIEDIVRFGQLIANDGNPLSPPQKKAPPVASLPMTVRLGHIDISTQMSAKDWKALGNLISGTDRSVAESFVASWLIRMVRLAIESKAELQRGQAIADAAVTVSPMDTDPFTVQLPNPDGHRVTVPSGSTTTPSGWYDSTYDPFVQDILPMRQLLSDKGYAVTRIIYSSRVQGVLLSNETVTRRTPGGVNITVSASGQLQSVVGASSVAALNGVFQSFGLPVPTVYDQRYSTQLGSYRYIEDSKFIFICATGQDETVVYPTEEGLQTEIIEDTLGYYGIGISEGHPNPGLIITPRVREMKPVGFEVEAYQESFPVINQPEAIAVLTIPEPTA